MDWIDLKAEADACGCHAGIVGLTGDAAADDPPRLIQSLVRKKLK
jgi:hypothetical protein